MGRVGEAFIEAADMPSTRIFSEVTDLQLSTSYRVRKYICYDDKTCLYMLCRVTKVIHKYKLYI